MSSLKFESLKDDFESISSRLDHQPISAQALTRLNSILSNLEDEARGAPERYRAGMIEDVEDYRKQLKNGQHDSLCNFCAKIREKYESKRAERFVRRTNS